MAILIDPPTWPAHGTVFAHVISDESLDELHSFADRAGLPDQAFDLDHYDIPARRYDDLVVLGAIPVSGRELIRRLRDSGLRIPARDRPEALRRTLRKHWQEAWRLRTDIGTRPGAGATLPASAPAKAPGPTPAPAGDPIAALGEDLLNRWAEPHRRYHDLRHLRDVLTALTLLCQPEPPPLEVVLAAWFHDAVYDGVPGADEQASADLARTSLARTSLDRTSLDRASLDRTSLENGPVDNKLADKNRVDNRPLDGKLVDPAEVARLVLVTRDHSPDPDDRHGALLCDADLAVLARDQADYRRYTRDVRAEYAHVPEPDFRTGRAAVVGHLLNLDPLYRTPRGRELWQERARANLRAELERLDHPARQPQP